MKHLGLVGHMKVPQNTFVAARLKGRRQLIKNKKKAIYYCLNLAQQNDNEFTKLYLIEQSKDSHSYATKNRE